MKSSNTRAKNPTHSSTAHLKFALSSRTVILLLLLCTVSLGISALVVRRAIAFNPSSPATFDENGGGPVRVTATAGTPGPTDYMTLGLAFDAINAGTHQGAITINIISSTTEAGTAVLNSNGAGAALYSSVLIRPTNDGVTISGPTLVGRGLIELNGADNVTIDGDNPNSGGTNRNLTVQNTAANTVNFTSVIRIALSTTLVTSADNCIFRNLNVLGNATGRNNAAAISTTASEFTTFGIVATSGASTVAATTPPSAITSVTQVIAGGATATNLMIQNNSISLAARGVSVNGSANTVFPGLQIANNVIGNPTAGAVDQIYAIGITAQGSADGVISGNTVYVEGFLPTSAATHAINVGLASATGTFTIEKNRVSRARNNNAQGWTAIGINLGGGVNHTVRNNFVFDVRNDQTAGTGAFGTLFGAYGIRIAAGTGHRIYHNSVHLFGVLPGAVSTNLTVAFIITANTQTGIDVRNNIFSNQLTGGNPTGASTRHAVLFLPSAATATMNLTINNNAYYQGPNATGPLSLLAQVGGTAGTGEFFAVNFNPGATTPATNLRAYTSTLSAAGTNDNASFAAVGSPPFVSDTDLHIPAGTPTRLESGGAPVGVTEDIDMEVRNATTPDIGADEFAGVPPPANDIAATAIVTPPNGGLVATGATVTPQAAFNNAGTATQNNVMVQFTITGPGGFNYTNTQTIAAITPGQTVTVTFAATPVFTTVGTYTSTATVTTPDSNSANDTVMGSFNVAAPLSGSINVGTGESFTSLTNPGGIFDALNGLGASGNVTVNVTTDLTAETGVISLNPVAGGFTVTIQPGGGAARTISGSGATALINLNGADNVTFNGLNTGGNSLLIRNTGAGSTIRLINDASNNSIQNCTIEGAGTAVILLSTGTATGNDNNTINGNTVRDRTAPAATPGNLISSIATAAILNSGTTITNNQLINFTVNGINIGAGNENINITANDISQTASRTTAIIGINVSVALGTGNTISRNTIHDLRTSVLGGTFISTAGIFILDSRAMTVSRNRIWNFPAVAGGTGRLVGIEFEGGTGLPSSCTVVNNMVSIVTTVATAQSVFGIFDFAFGGNTFTADHNSVYVGGTASGAANSWAFNRGAEAPTNYTARNNIAFNNRTGGTGSHFAGGDQSGGTGTFISNFNFFAGTGAGTAANFMDYSPTSGLGTPVSFATWQAGPPPRDANSVAGVASTFNPTDFFVDHVNGDLHLKATATPVLDAGTPLASVTTDFDNQPRSATAPDIGADEFTAGTPGVLQYEMAAYSVSEAAGTATITVTRTGGTSGTVTVDYATVAGGTATGGPVCTPGVDYINTSGTLTFGDGVTSQSFNITICNNTINEPSETVNLALSNVTGGATIGMQSTAVLTITDDDPAGPVFTISNARTVEGNSGSHDLIFTVTLTSQGPPAPNAAVSFTTVDGTALAGSDYVPTSGTLFFGAPTLANGGVITTTRTIGVPIFGDFEKEANETFFINLSTPVGGSIADGQAVGIIIDDDRHYTSDVDHDRLGDFVVFRPSEGVWYSLQSSNGFTSYRFFGANGDKPVPGDYDGDATLDLAVFRQSTGYWYVERSSDFGFVEQRWGLPTDKAVQGDYDGDAKTDIAIFRNGEWYVLESSKNILRAVVFGVAGDKPVPADYDGDRRTDIAVFRNGVWYIRRSSDDTMVAKVWGLGSDRLVPSDYDGDGSADVAVFRNGQWYILESLTGNTRATTWGMAGDIPVMADYDGNGTSDIAVFRNGDWYILTSDFTDSTVITRHWGQAGDIPAASAYVPEH